MARRSNKSIAKLLTLPLLAQASSKNDDDDLLLEVKMNLAAHTS
jgi:hypothetical protein